ncbi:ectonucleoside triphosphate diphosphohydrolase 8 isoform X2 [Leopardus geoffroyi]|uniref:ectonucleoside triphosphate diphosphohydrolase 8 isoform X2 n=1 Tax=Leopardus geoffroyi TaxID=46844 RepID=UPI001E25DDAE|nr:ectonucleoside triphosphate diphosphohydrolase 8 isoform X2 [Leopardus geoffroyi]
MGLTWKPRVLTALLGAAVASGLTTLILILVEATDVLLPTDTKFGIVFDAGSSHTSLFVYRWPADKENDTGVVSQALVCRAKGPGISSYASNPAQAGESLQGCLEEALALIPEAQQRKTPLFLGATAGMRLLGQKNSSQARDIFEAVTQALGKSPLDFWGAELLAGQDEGALGWITINYVLGMLVKYSFSGEWTQPLEGTLVGALDMGGASTQITFVPGGPILDKSTQTTFRLYGSEHRVYTHSYLCFGRDQMLSRLLAQLVQSSSGPLVRHPCYHSGYWATLSPAALYESPCVHTAAPPELAGNLTVEGTGNPGACIAAIRGLFNFSSCQGRGHCAFNGVYQPPVRGQFYAFSNFYYTFHFLNLTSKQPLATVNATIWEFCQRPWKQVEASSPGQDRWLRDYCPSGLYILTLLLEGYGFSEETWPGIEFRKQDERVARGSLGQHGPTCDSEKRMEPRGRGLKDHPGHPQTAPPEPQRATLPGASSPPRHAA